MVEIDGTDYKKIFEHDINYKRTAFIPTKSGKTIKIITLFKDFPALVNNVNKDLSSFWKGKLGMKIHYTIEATMEEVKDGKSMRVEGLDELDDEERKLMAEQLLTLDIYTNGDYSYSMGEKDENIS